MASFLQYRFDAKCPTNELEFRGVVNPYPLIPCNDEVHPSSSTRTEAGHEWKDANGGSFDGSFSDLFNRDSITSSNYGYRYRAITQKNGLQLFKWFDVGSEGLRYDDSVIDAYARSSWVRNCTGLWLLTNTQDMQNNRGCSGSIMKMAIRYRNPSTNRMVIKCCDDKVSSDLSYGDSHYHSTSPVIWGYRLSSSDRSTVINNNYELLGFRIAVRLWREASGVHDDHLRFGITSLTPTFGTSGGSYSPTNKRIISRAHDTPRNGINGDWQIEAS